MYPNDLDPQWLAGLFDGDGSVGIYMRKPQPESGRPSPEYFVHCQISQNNPTFCRWLTDKANGNCSFHKPSPKYAGRWGGAYVVYWTHAKAEITLRLIAPYAVIKKPEIEIALQFRAYKRKPGDIRPPPEYWQRLEAFKMEMHDAKKARKLGHL